MSELAERIGYGVWAWGNSSEQLRAVASLDTKPIVKSKKVLTEEQREKKPHTQSEIIDLEPE